MDRGHSAHAAQPALTELPITEHNRRVYGTLPKTPRVALNQSETPRAALSTALRRDGERYLPALCRELPPAEIAPEWIELIPNAGRVQGIDGRWFNFNDGPGLVERLNARERKPMLDWEHASAKTWSDIPAPAAGWFTQFEIRDNGSLWGRVDWTPNGAQSVKNRDYRYVSPEFLFDREKQILALPSAALTNRPNLVMSALNASDENGADEMNPELLAALGLAPDATATQALNAVNDLKSRQADMMRFVPKEQYETACNRISELEADVRRRDEAEHGAEVERAINEGVRAGKLAPATVEYYRAQCATPEGLNSFNQFLKLAPVIGKPTAPPPGDPPGTETALNANDRAVAKQLGLTDAEMVEMKKAERQTL